jgi:hypothetical protein
MFFLYISWIKLPSGDTRYSFTGIHHEHKFRGKSKFMEKHWYTSGFWPRVPAPALRAPVFLGSLPRQSFSISSYSSLLILLFLSLLILLIPALPIEALNLTALLMIYRENPAKIPAKNPPKYSTAYIVQQSNCRWHCQPTCYSI